MTSDEPPPGAPVAEHLSEIARRLKEIEAEKQAALSRKPIEEE